MSMIRTQQLLDRVAGLLRTETRNLLLDYGLQPVHFEALYYLSICNRYSDTPMGVTEYLGQTKGTISQSLKNLEKKKLIRKQADSEDKRVVHLQLTQAGKDIVDSVLPSPLLQSVDNAFSKQDNQSLEMLLQKLLKNMQQSNGFKSFGQCASCTHNIEQPTGQYTCGLTKETLSTQDIQLICREHAFG